MEKKTKAAPAKAAIAKKIPAKKGAAKGLQDLFEDSLKDIYWAEKALSKALPKMEKNASSAELKNAIAGHLKETTNQITRLEKCFDSIGKKAIAKKCDAMAGLLEESKGIIEDCEVGSVRDAGIIAGAQKVEHYEIATYGTLAAFAKVLGHKVALKELLASLAEEKACDEKLSAIADTTLNTSAIDN
jgi:ferritin-like metal-binding protein YciE